VNFLGLLSISVWEQRKILVGLCGKPTPRAFCIFLLLYRPQQTFDSVLAQPGGCSTHRNNVSFNLLRLLAAWCGKGGKSGVGFFHTFIIESIAPGVAQV
jgi:hypothetical protein